MGRVCFGAALAGALGVLAAGLRAEAGSFYRVDIIDDDPSVNVIAWGLNDAGTCVGWYVAPFEPARAFRWNVATGLELLPTPPGETDYIAREISNTGIIGGGHEFGSAWTFADGVYNMLGTLPGHASAEVWGVNRQGDAAGTADPSDLLAFTAFFYDSANDEMMEIAPRGSRAWDVNDSRQVVGHQGSNAFRWTPAGGLEFLGPLDDVFRSTFAFAVNEAGDVVGEAKNPQNQNQSRAFVFTDEGGMMGIPPLGGRNRAWGINDRGAVVGESEKTGGGNMGWLWTPAGGLVRLTDLISPAEHMNILAGYDINNRGQIVALAFDNDLVEFVAVLLTPPGGPPGDFDGDGDVDIADFAFFAACFGGSGIPCSGECCAADLDGDGDVDIADFSTFSANFTGSR